MVQGFPNGILLLCREQNMPVVVISDHIDFSVFIIIPTGVPSFHSLIVATMLSDIEFATMVVVHATSDPLNDRPGRIVIAQLDVA